MRKLRFSSGASGSSIPVLVEAARYGDENAYRELIERTYKSVKSYCSAIGSRHDCEDLAQEAYVRAIRGKTEIVNVENPEAYMIVIAKCVCADYHNAKSKVNTLKNELEDLPEKLPLTTDCKYDLELLHGLSEEHKQILVLISVLGFSYSDAAQVLNVPIGTIRSRFNRAKEISKNLLTNGTIFQHSMTS